MSDQHVPALDEPAAFGTANSAFHEALVAMTGNETLIILYEMVNEVVARAVTAVSQAAGAEEDNGSTATRRPGVRSQRRLVELIEAGDAHADEEHWRTPIPVVGRVLLGQLAQTVLERTSVVEEQRGSEV